MSSNYTLIIDEHGLVGYSGILYEGNKNHSFWRALDSRNTEHSLWEPIHRAYPLIRRSKSPRRKLYEFDTKEEALTFIEDFMLIQELKK